MQVMSSFGDHDRSRYTLIPPDRGRLRPNSSITKAPQVEIAPAVTQSINAKPGLPLNLKIEAGVEKILLQVSSCLDCTLDEQQTRHQQFY